MGVSKIPLGRVCTRFFPWKNQIPNFLSPLGRFERLKIPPPLPKQKNKKKIEKIKKGNRAEREKFGGAREIRSQFLSGDSRGVGTARGDPKIPEKIPKSQKKTPKRARERCGNGDKTVEFVWISGNVSQGKGWKHRQPSENQEFACLEGFFRDKPGNILLLKPGIFLSPDFL